MERSNLSTKQNYSISKKLKKDKIKKDSKRKLFLQDSDNIEAQLPSGSYDQKNKDKNTDKNTNKNT